ncbi:MAG: ABC transporter substrate-binding protein, partial [Thermomicrobiales bacterium]
MMTIVSSIKKVRAVTLSVISLALVASVYPGSNSWGSTSGPSAGIDQSQPVVYSAVAVGQTFDVFRTNSTNDFEYFQPVYDMLLTTSKTGSYVPQLALSWDVTPTSVTFKLRPGVRFQDGTNFDASAVKANLERAMTLENSTSKTLLAAVTSIEASAPDTVKINVKDGALSLLALLANPQTPGPSYMVSPSSFDSNLATQAVGTGPYKVVSVAAGRSSVEYELWEGSWDKRALTGAKKLKFIVNGNSGQRLNQVIAGQADVAYIDGALAQKAKDAGLQVRVDQLNNSYYVGINRTRNAFASLDARRVLFLGIDRQSLLDNLRFGFGQPGTQFASKGTPGYNASIKLEYDPDEARKLAKSSGLTRRPVEMLVWNLPSIQSFGEAVQAMLGSIGVNVKVTLADTASLIPTWKAGKHDLLVTYVRANLGVDQTAAVNRLFSVSSPENASGPPPADLAKLMADATAARTVEQQEAAFAAIAGLIDSQALALFLVKQGNVTIG